MFRKLLLASLYLSSYTFADQTIWKGEVSSDGTPSSSIKLTLGKTYVFKSMGKINLGKWRQAGGALAQDSCYEFEADKAARGTPEHYVYLKNSLDISLCDGTFHADHIYKSAPFKAERNSVHFWVWDTDYSDNTGSFQVEVILVDGN